MSISLSDLLIDATRIPSRKLLRDYYELESLQNTGRQNDNFLLQSLKRTRENIAFELLKHKITSNFFFQGDKRPSNDIYIYIVPIDSPMSFSRAKPFFGIMATLFKNNQPEMCVINFPSTKEIIYAEKGRGLWVEKLNRNDNDPLKLRTSSITETAKAHIITDSLSLLLEHKDFVEGFANIEIINSPLYNLYLLCHGIVDVSIISIESDSFFQSISLICQESGASLKLLNDGKNAIITNGKIDSCK